ncbi:MAG: SUMF1/EgtB/PvdO family nonheme iron enzyme [Magnetococcales bacterium]|nr:SUMF1/EgtB/PvdO family nonheme iron enzyme [Magnetococcales bacterium]
MWTLLEGEVIQGQYHLRRLLGSGGYGGVFLADEVLCDRLVRQVAIKLLPIDRERLDEQLRELVASRFDHPNLLRYLTHGVCRVGRHEMLFLVMDVAEARLDAVLQQGVLDPRQARILAWDLATGLAYLHGQRACYVHRDLKPGNVLYLAGRWKLADFGLLRAVGERALHSRTLLGTPDYAPPEAHAGVVTPAWDLWSLGMLLVESLTGLDPARAGTVPLPPPFAELVAGCLEAAWNRRWDARQVLACLAAADADAQAFCPPPGLPPPRPVGRETLAAVREGGALPAATAAEPTPSSNATGMLVPPTRVATAPRPADGGATVSRVPVSPLLVMRGADPDLDARGAVPNARRPAPTAKAAAGGGLVPPASVSIPAPMFDPALPSPPTRARQPVDGDRTRRFHCPVTGLPFVSIPGGAFMMGREPSRGRADAQPAHAVTIDPFWLGVYPVTQAAWVRVMGHNPSRFGKVDSAPVEWVSWEEVQTFLAALNSRVAAARVVYRLPTEAEWEYACRGGERACDADDPPLDRIAWHAGNSEGAPHPVGEKLPNALGLYDMIGNVGEWVADWYDPGYYARAPRHNPRGPVQGTLRVHRGGSWYDLPEELDGCRRFFAAPTERNVILGFRLLCIPARA